MNNFTKYFGIMSLVATVGCGASFAQMPAPAAPTTTVPATPATPAMPKAAMPATTAPKAEPMMDKSAKPRTEKSKECSKQADAKKLHGKERQKFREECKKAA